MAASDKDLESQLLESGNRLVEPPSSVDELLPLLDKVESSLSKVEQSPSESMQNALSPSLNALVRDTLLKHSDVDVRVAVASCISEITRITAPDAPYDDDRMKEVFQLIVSSFEYLCDESSRSYIKRTSILETVAKVRSCVVMLDLECDALILEMFRHFLNAIRDYHPANVFSSMETIMTLVLEESEDISLELLTCVLNCVKIDEEVLPIARKLGERVLEACATKVKPYLVQGIKDLGISLDDYSTVLGTICQEANGKVEVQATDENMAVDSSSVKPSLDSSSQEDKAGTTAVSLEQAVISMDRTSQSAMNNGTRRAVGYDSLADSSCLNKQEKDQQIESNKDLDASSNADPESSNTEKAADAENTVDKSTRKAGRKICSSAEVSLSEIPHTDIEKEIANNEKNTEKHLNKVIPDSPHEGPSAGEAIRLQIDKESAVKLSSPKALDIEHSNVASLLLGEKLQDEFHSKISGQQKKDFLDKEVMASVDDVSKTVADMTSDFDVKTNRRSGKKVSANITNENKVVVEVDVCKKESATTSDSEVKTNRRSRKKVAAANSTENKALALLNVYKNESGITSDIEAKPVRQPVSTVDGCGKNDDGSSAKHGDHKKKRAEGKALSEKDGAIALPKSAGKATKDELKLEETPKTNSKRKLNPCQAKDFGDKGFGEDWIGLKVRVWWPKDQVYYDGFIESFDPVKKKHKVLYNDGDEEVLNLKREKWEFIEGDFGSDKEDEIDRSSPDASTESHLKKKGKIEAGEPFKQKKIDSLPKKGGGVSSKGTPKSRCSYKADRKFKDNDDSKSVGKSEEGRGSKSKNHTPKSASSKLSKVLSKSSSKSKKESSSPFTKSKQELQKAGKSKSGTPKTATVSKDQSGGKSSASGTGKVKSGLLKIEEVVDAEESYSVIGKKVESIKCKSSNTPQAQESEVKTGKKRRRSMKC